MQSTTTTSESTPTSVFLPTKSTVVVVDNNNNNSSSSSNNNALAAMSTEFSYSLVQPTKVSNILQFCTLFKQVAQQSQQIAPRPIKTARWTASKDSTTTQRPKIARASKFESLERLCLKTNLQFRVLPALCRESTALTPADKYQLFGANHRMLVGPMSCVRARSLCEFLAELPDHARKAHCNLDAVFKVQFDRAAPRKRMALYYAAANTSVAASDNHSGGECPDLNACAELIACLEMKHGISLAV
jgi:hypothetical protein